MTGWQRFFLLILCYFIVLVLFPHYDAKGISFVFLSFGMWTGVIILLSIFINLFALYKLPPLNALITVAFVAAVFGSLLIYFPQKDRPAPINQLKHGEIPSSQDVELGIRQLTFNFDFVRRNVNRDENYINQETIDDTRKRQREEAEASALEEAKAAEAKKQAEEKAKAVERKKKEKPQILEISLE